MTPSEYQDLVEFLGRRFDAIDARFDAVETRLTRVEVLVEENRNQIQIVAESVTSLTEVMTREFAAVRKEMAEGFRLQGNMILALSDRMDRWEGLSA